MIFLHHLVASSSGFSWHARFFTRVSKRPHHTDQINGSRVAASKRGIAHDISRGTTKLFSLLERENHKAHETVPKSNVEQAKTAPEPVEKNVDDKSVKVDKGSSFIFYSGRTLQIEGKPVVKRDFYRRQGEFYETETFYGRHRPENCEIRILEPTHPQGL
ncbi:hypothetical protein RUND412_009000 [Rhizina undulata]